MEDYGDIYGFGKHTIRVTLQSGVYKGHISFDIGGNTKGLQVLAIDLEDIAWASTFKENDCNFKISEDEELFSMVLRDKESEELHISESLGELEEYVVALEIVNYVKE